MSDRRDHPSNSKILHLWFVWALASTLGVAIGLIAMEAALAGLWIPGICVGPVALGALAGVMQAPMIGMVHRLGIGTEAVWPIPFRWIVATIVGLTGGFVLALTILLSVESAGTDGWVGAAMGFFVGLVQSQILRGQLLHASGWILTNTLSWAIGFAAGDTLSRVTGDQANSILVGGIGEAVFVGAIVGASTGILLVWILKDHARAAVK